MKGEKNKLYDNKHTVREKGKEGDYYWYIYMYTSHPCAYVGVGPDHPIFDLDYQDVDVECHYGLTYSHHNEHNSMSCMKADIKWFGWDYGHAGDYSDYGKEINNAFGDGFGKKWTIKEIKEDIKAVIKGFRELAEKRGVKTKCTDCFGYQITEAHWACNLPSCIREDVHD